MYKCKNCGKEVKYIPATNGCKMFIVDAELKTFITQFGREGKGYNLHICEVKTDGKGNIKTD